MPAARKGFMIFINVIVFGYILVMVYNSITDGGASDLSVGNMSYRGDMIEFTIANTTSRTGDVVVWFEDGDVTRCERVFQMNANERSTVGTSCAGMGNTVTIVWGWAEDYPDHAVVAQRIER